MLLFGILIYNNYFLLRIIGQFMCFVMSLGVKKLLENSDVNSSESSISGKNAEQKLYSMKMDYVEVMVPNIKKNDCEDKLNFPGMLFSLIFH